MLLPAKYLHKTGNKLQNLNIEGDFIQNLTLKENRRHGDILLPINTYHMIIPSHANIFDCHWHDEFELFKLDKGEALVQIGSTYRKVQEGDLLFINSGELHAAKTVDNSGCNFRAAVFSPEMLLAPANDQILIKYVAPILNGHLILHSPIKRQNEHENNIQECFDEIYRLIKNQPAGYELAVKANLFLLFGEFIACSHYDNQIRTVKKDTGTIENIKNIINYIEKNYPENLTIQLLAERMNVSPGHFCRLFKQYTMKTPIQYINYYRLSKAMELLQTTDRKILDIALDTGFNSMSYFINVFRENMGCTPSEYRKRIKAK